ncbi:cytochrome P450 [Tanacetum coccineum]
MGVFCIAWNNNYRITNRVTWLNISGLPPQLWLHSSFTAIAKLWGTILIPEEYNPRKFNRSFGKVCILTNFTSRINDSVPVSVGNESIMVRDYETEEDVESSDSDEDSDNDNNDGGNADDKISVTVKNSNGFPNMAATDSDIPSPRVSETHSKEGSTSPAIPRVNDKYLDMSVPFSHKVPDVTLYQSVDKSTTKRSLPPSPQVYNPTTSVKHDQTSNLRKKNFVSLKFFDSLNDNNIQSKRSKKSKTKRISVSQPKSPTTLASDGSVSIEVDKTIEIGNDLGFNMTGKNDDVAFILANGIQETMTSTVDQFLIKQLWNNTPYEFVVKESNGKSGGIIAVWDCTSFSLISTTVGDGFLSLLGTWQSLFHSVHDNLSVVMGDFNEVRSPSERMGSVFNQIGASKFNKFIANAGLLSDHSPLLLINRLVDYGPTPFKFYNSWLLHKDFHLLVTSCWAFTTNRYNLKSVSFKKRLQSLKNSIKSWRQTTKIEESSTATALRNRLDYIDLKAESAPLTPSDIAFRTATVNELSCLEF